MQQIGAKLLLVAATLTALTVTAACGSSGSGTKSSGNGSTITIGSAAPIASSVLSQPELKGAEQAAVSAINAKGGVKGHKLKLDFCDTTDTANGEFTCMRKLVNDKVAAIVDPTLIVDQSGRGLKYAGAQGYPIIGGAGLTPVEFSTKGSFPMSSGIPGWSYGQVVSLIDAGAKKIALFGTTEPGSQYILSFTQQAMKEAKLTPVRYVKADPNADPTFAQSAAKVIAGGVDGVIYDSSPTYGAKAVQALRAAGYNGPVASITAVFNPQSTKSLGSQANNLYLTSQMALSTDTANPGVQKFLAAMKKYQPKVQIDETAMTGWSAVQLFAAAAGKISGDITHTSVLAAMNNIASPINLQTAGPYRVKGAASTINGYPRIYNPTVVIGLVKNGVLEPFAKGFVNPFTSLTNR